MSLFLFIVGAVFNTHEPNAAAVAAGAPVSGASYGMAVCIYLFVVNLIDGFRWVSS